MQITHTQKKKKMDGRNKNAQAFNIVSTFS